MDLESEARMVSYDQLEREWGAYRDWAIKEGARLDLSIRVTLDHKQKILFDLIDSHRKRFPGDSQGIIHEVRQFQLQIKEER
jgi:hypothetical protein